MKLSFEDYQHAASQIEFQSTYRICYWDSALKKIGQVSQNGQSSVSVSKSALNTDKPAVLFLHGFPSASWDWHAQWSELKKDYRCIAFDMLGFGLSDKPKKHAYSVLEQADIARVLLRKLGVNTCHIVAHDYGVSVAQQLLSISGTEGALSIESICFLNGGLFAHLHRPLFTQKLLHGPLGSVFARLSSKSTLARSFKKIFGKHSPPSQHDIDLLWRLIQVNDGHLVLPRLLDYLDERKTHASRWLSHMQASKKPLAFINGTQDPISGKHMLDHFNKVLPKSASKALAVGHYPQLEAKEEVLQLIQRFLKQGDFG